MNLEPHYFYLALTTPFVIAWGVLFLLSRGTRREQFRISVAFGFVGIFVENVFYFKDYWHPPAVFGISLGPVAIYPEFLLFGAAFAGIAAVIYPAAHRLTFEDVSIPGKYVRAGVCAAWFLAVSFGVWFAGINSIYATATASLVLAAVMGFQRRDLVLPALFSGVGTVVVMFALYGLIVASIANLEEILASIWYLHNTPLDMRLAGIPLTELVWGFCAGSAVGVFYPYVRGARYVRV